LKINQQIPVDFFQDTSLGWLHAGIIDKPLFVMPLYLMKLRNNLYAC